MLTPDEARERLRKAGRSVGDVARELKVDRSIVAGVLSGKIKGKRGDSHKVAVALGIKDGVIVPDDASVAEVIKLAGGAR